MLEHAMYYLKPSYFNLVRSLGGKWGDTKQRPVVCLIRSTENPDLYWAIPVGRFDHRDQAAIKRVNFYLNCSNDDIRSCFYHIGRTDQKSIFMVSKALPITDKYIDRTYRVGSNPVFIIKNTALLSDLQKKLVRILAFENSRKDYFEQHITTIKQYLLNEMKGISKIMNAELDREVKITKTSPDGRPAEYEFPNGTKIGIEFVSTVYEPKSKDDEEQCTYCKVIKLEHSGENNGVLLATRETVGGGDDFYPIYESRDDGKSWKEIAVVRDDFNESGKAGWQPYLYELPTDIGDFKEGTVILGGCSRNAGRGISKSMMTLYKSVDCGRHWEGFATIYEWGGIAYALT